MKYIIEAPIIPSNDKERYIKTHGTPYEEPKQGEWIENGLYDMCSCCNRSFLLSPTDKYNYCPNCGSKMGSH